MKSYLLLAAISLATSAHGAGIELTEQGKNQQAIYYYCAVSDRFVYLSAQAALSGGNKSMMDMAENAGSPLLIDGTKKKDLIEYFKQNLDEAQQVSMGYNSGQTCYLAPQKWIFNYEGLVSAGKIKTNIPHNGGENRVIIH